MTKKLKIPYGFQDFLPDECYNKDRLENEIAKLFKSYGYYKTETPTIEYYDTFYDVYDPSKLKKMFKLTDNDGSLLALRPDITLQLCRMSANLDPDFPKRLYYIENSFEYQDSADTARTREFPQIGVELLGDTGIDGEEEVISLAIESFLCAGLNEFTVDIGNNSVFKGIIASCGLDKDDIAQLKALINRKDGLGTEMFLQRKEVPKSVALKLTELPSLFGGSDTFERAKRITDNIGVSEAVKHTEKLFERLLKHGYEKYISVDFGMLQGLDYYSGTVIKGYSASHGFGILDGGRYDGICPSFGYGSGAVGFAIGTKRLLSALDELGKLSSLPSCDYAYFSDASDMEKERAYVDALRKAGQRVVKIFTSSESELKSYCEKQQIKKAFYIKNGELKEIVEKENFK